MKYTPEQVELFNKMFSVTREYDLYLSTKMCTNGLLEEQGESSDRNYNADSVEIEVKDRCFSIHFGECNAEEEAIKAFDKFIELNYNENAFIKWLESQLIFH